MTTTYPEQLVLPGQTAAPDGPIDMMMMYLMHHAFRRDLRRFAGAVPLTPVDDLATWQALRDRWDWFGHVLHKHHTGEDAGIWPFLLDRADPDERETLLAMEAEHERIDPLLASCEVLFAALADPGDRGGRAATGSPGDRGGRAATGGPGDRGGRAATVSRSELRAALAARLADAEAVLGQHLRHEETGAIAILQRHTTPEDWERIEEEHFSDKESLGFLRTVVCWIAEDVPEEHLARVFATAGQAFRVVWWLSRRGWRRREARAFRHLPR
ncbi:MAG TPA: hemerythrin domain-containing protein [Nocardioides sp.]|nr:hemerythrin domain-containing protein [Nocardioides sp.]